MTNVVTMGPHRIWFDEGTNILHLEINWDFSIEDSKEYGRISKRMLMGFNGRRIQMIDLTNAKAMDRVARGQLKDFSVSYGEDPELTAIICPNPVVRMFAKIIMRSSRTRSNFFKNEEEAMAWINSTLVSEGS